MISALKQRLTMQTFIGFLLTGLLLVLGEATCLAAERPGSEFRMQIRNRLEVIASTEGLSPADTYGRWNTLNMNYFRQAREDTLVYAQLTGHSRKEGGGLQTGFGVIKDWNKSMFTNTSIGFGTNVSFLPSYSIDHDFSFKFGKDKRYIWSAGAAYVKYHSDQSDLILKTGLAAYLNKWVLDYHVYRNISNPGSVESFSHRFSVAYGLPKRSWTTLTYSFGRQAYLAAALATPSLVNNESQFVSLNYRRWLGPHHGFIAEVNYLNLIDAYNKLGFSLGFFREY